MNLDIESHRELGCGNGQTEPDAMQESSTKNATSFRIALTKSDPSTHLLGLKSTVGTAWNGPQ
jgi:hypothetical protein